MSDKPTFKNSTSLARYIHELHRSSGNRPKSAAFIEAQAVPGEENQRHLSVNSLDIENITEIANYYRLEIQKDDKQVAVCIHRLTKYNSNANKSGIRVTYNPSAFQFEFAGFRGSEPAYKWRPLPKRAHRSASPSHCGVEFIRALNDLQERALARRMASEGKFHLL